jgi:hypothetical protein
MPDVLLLPDTLGTTGIQQLYAEVDWVVPHGDLKQAEHAHASGARVLNSLHTDAWRSATAWVRSHRNGRIASNG